MDRSRNYSYPSPLDESLTCSICKDPFYDPAETPCGHTFCKECILHWIDHNECCPLDMNVLKKGDLKPAKLEIVDQLNGILVECSQCNEQMERQKFGPHIALTCSSQSNSLDKPPPRVDQNISTQATRHAMNAGFGCEYKYYRISVESLPKNFNSYQPVSTGVIPGIDLQALGARGILAANENDVEGALADFALVLSGVIEITHSGIHTFFLTANDGANLYIDDELVVDNDGIHYVIEKSQNKELCTGFHTFRIEYFHACGKLLEGIREGARLDLLYSFKGTNWYGADAIKKQEIPLLRLRLPAAIDLPEDTILKKPKSGSASASRAVGISSSSSRTSNITVTAAEKEKEDMACHYEDIITSLTQARDEGDKRVTELERAQDEMKQVLFISAVVAAKLQIATSNPENKGALPVHANISAQSLYEHAQHENVPQSEWGAFVRGQLFGRSHDGNSYSTRHTVLRSPLSSKKNVTTSDESMPEDAVNSLGKSKRYVGLTA
eukprot:CFRG1259T1